MHLCVCLLLVAFAVSAWCNYTLAAGWRSGGLPVASTLDDELDPLIVPDGNGGAVIAWQWLRIDSAGIYAIGLNSDGNMSPGWVPGGRLVHAGSDPHMVADGAGGAFIASRSFSGVAIQRFGPSLSAGGTVMRTLAPEHPAADPHETVPAGAVGVQHDGFVLPVVLPDGQGGVFVTFTDNQRFYDDAFVRHYVFGGPFSEAQLVGRPSCLPLVCYGDRTPAICPDGAGGVFVAWGSSCGARVLRVTTSLTIVPGWPDSGLAVEPCRLSRPYLGICADEAGGAYVAWQGYPSGPSDLRIQRVTGSGSIAGGWPGEGLVLSPHSTLPGTSRKFGEFCAIVPDGLGGALVTWTDKRADDGDIYVTRVTPAGTVAPGWARFGVGASVAPGIQQWPQVVADGAGGAVVVWQDEQSAPDLAIYANRLSSNGDIIPDGVLVSSGPGSRLVPRLASDGAGGAIIVWIDYRAGNADVYAARVLADGTVGTLADLVAAQATPDGVRLEWRVSAEVRGPLRLERRSAEYGFDLLASLWPDGSRRVAYLDRDVEPGWRYGYRLGLIEGGQGVVTGETWVDVPALDLALRGAQPNPSGRQLSASITLPDMAPATLELVDVSGRQLLAREVGGLGAGRHLVDMTPDEPLAAGVYWLRLTQGGRMLAAKTALVK